MFFRRRPPEECTTIVVGLGNPEERYKGTRHNVGFETIDKLAFDHNIKVNRAKHRGVMGFGLISEKKIALLQPLTYMNRSGECIKAVLNFYKLTPANVLVICDDVNLPLGSIRVRERGSAGGQNGLKNIIELLGTQDFARIRIGVGPKPEQWALYDFVLSRFKPEEHTAMIDGVTKAGDAVAVFLADGAERAMNRFNGKS
ncbi:MAG: aminoacyl-tRNA hydrolase [Defluviitaleaceae bacterium]|nr:aminoacyl-tRNA hydrolase [Defluviitaleaceae bacterium]